MQIIKSDNTKQQFLPNKILKRLKDQSKNLNVDYNQVFKQCVAGVIDGMTTKEVDNLLAITSANMIIQDPDYSYLAARIILTRHGKIIGVEPIDSDYLFDFVGITSFLYKYSLRNDQGEPIELPHMMYKRVAKHLCGDDSGWQKYYNYLREQKISLATPILMNAGSDRRKSYISCNLSTLESDSTDGILNTLSDASKASRDGAGIGLHIHSLRSSESLVSSFNGTAGGVVRFADMLQSHMRFFKQGNRSGSAAMYLGIWHRDIENFLELRLPVGDEKMRARDLFTACCIPDIFMEKLNEGEDDWYLFCPKEVEDAGFKQLHETWGAEFNELYNKLVEAKLGRKVSVRGLWSMITKSLVESGLPYINYWDNMNRRNPQSNIGIRTGSNLCVSGNTLLLTDKGNIPIQDISGTIVNVWNGESFTSAPVFKTGDDDILYRVSLSNKEYIDCTANHRWFIKNHYGRKEKESTTLELKVGDKLAKFELPTIEGTEELSMAYTQGFYSGDGCNPNDGKCNTHHITLYGEKTKLIPFLDIRNKLSLNTDEAFIKKAKNGSIRIGLPLDIILDRFFVPDESYTIKSRLEWFAGLCDSDGCIARSSGWETLQVTSVEYDFLFKVKRLVNSLGIHCKIGDRCEEGYRPLPKNDGTGESKMYYCKKGYILLITSNGLYRLVNEFNIPFKRLEVFSEKPQRDARRHVKVVSVDKLEGTHKSYCVTESEKNKATFNNTLTGNCHEVMQVTKSGYTAQCCLGLVPLSNLDKNDWKSVEKYTKALTYLLNKVIDINLWSNPSSEKAGEDQRAIGIGIAGLSDYLQNHNIPYISKESEEFNKKVMETIYKTAKTTSNSLAVNYYKKSYPSWDGSDYQKEGVAMSNSLLVALMPSASTSILLGCTESFEAPHSNIFVRKLDVGEFTITNKYLVRDLKKLGLWTKDIQEHIILSEGSIQGIEGIPNNIKDVYKTIWEIKMKDYIHLASVRQENIDQAQSMNLYFNDPTTGKVSGALNYAWSLKLPTGSYYTKTKSALSAPSRLAVEKKTSTEIAPGFVIDCFGCSA